MKKLFTIISLTVVVFACTPKAAPVGSTSSSTNANSTNTNNTNTAVSTTATETNAAPATPSSVDETAIAEGHTIFNSKCGKCHGLKNPGDFTSAKWDGILKIMAPKAKLSASETAQVAAYVKANAKPAQP